MSVLKNLFNLSMRVVPHILYVIAWRSQLGIDQQVFLDHAA